MKALLLICAAALGCGGSDPPDPGTPGHDGGIPGSGQHAADLAGDDGAAAPTGGNAPFMAPCMTNDDCASHICNDYPARGGDLCTFACTAADWMTTCPPPSTGCNNKGVCKL